MEGLIYGGKFAFQNRLGCLIVGRKFTVFALSYFAFEGNFQVQAPGELIFALRVWGVYILRGLYMEGLIFGISQYFASGIQGVKCSTCRRRSWQFWLLIGK